MGGRPKAQGGSRAARIALLLALDAALIAVLWKVAAPRLFGRGPGAPAAVEAAAPDRGFAAERGADSAAHDLAAPATPAARSAAAAAERRATFTLPPAGPRRDRALEERLRAAIGDALGQAEEASKGRVKRGEVTVAVCVRDAASGAELCSIGAEKLLRPASNLKLVTSASALVLLGPEWRFETTFESDAPLADGVLRGDLVVHGGGDPLYDPAAGGDVTALLAPVVKQLRENGVRRVAGRVVLDERRFLEPGPGPAWPPEGQHWSEFCARSGAFNANAGCLTARVRPGRAGGPAQVEVFPRGHGLPQRIDVRTGPARSKLDVRVSAISGTVVVEGSFPSDADSWQCRFAAPDPVQLFGGALLAALRAGGVEVQGGLARERVALRPGSRQLARLATPITDVLTPINAHSNNCCADQLFLALGDARFGQGDRAGGRRATSLALERLGVPDDGFVQVDGSGLSRDNRVSARQITALLTAVLQRGGRSATALLDSMAAPHADGTLDDRLEGLEGRVRAKTGFIAGTSALSGILDAEDGRQLVFSILVDYPAMDGLNRRVWKPMQDRLCRILAGVRG